MARPTADTVQLTLRIPSKWFEDADGIAAQISEPGRIATRTDVFRLAIARGLQDIGRERAKDKGKR